jgi:hypothetical protein
MAWRAARSLTTFHAQLQREAPRAAPAPRGQTRAAAWGLIGDAEHDPTSDHAPHDFPGWGNDIVTAADIPNRPDLGLDAWKVLDNIRRSRDARVKYAISNGQVFSNRRVTQGGRTYDAYTWRPYRRSNGSRYADEHYTHGHLSVVGDSRSDGTQPWATKGAPVRAQDTEDDMGASFGPQEIKVTGVTSLCIPPVRDGAADPRANWLNVCNDTLGERYGLRIFIGSGGDHAFAPLSGIVLADGLIAIHSGGRYSWELPEGTAVVSIMRVPVNQDTGSPITNPGPDDPAPYAGHLTCCIERGPVVP